MKRTSKSARRSLFQTLEIKTTWGKITLTLNGDRVVALDLPHLNKTPSAEFSVMNSEIFSSDFFQTLEKKFPKFGTLQGTDFQKSVWRELRKIPRGQTRTYSAIAAAIGNPKAVRAVGSACGANPLPVFIPCHRVVAKNGLGGFGSGLPWKILLLKMEGAL
ncbi:MAG: MGMT family protein [Kiritimatiellales bacterium]